MRNVVVVLMIYVYAVGSTNILLHSVTGTVGGGNFTYWSLSYTGHIVITLQSMSGDADLYVAEKNAQPTYEHYDLHSASCGEDVVDVPKSFGRPIGIGIYGHSSFENSSYSLEVFYDVEKSTELDVFERGAMSENASAEEKSLRAVFRKIRLRSSVKTMVFTILELAEMTFILHMFS